MGWSGIAAETQMKFVTGDTRLYKQERENPKGPPQLGLYVRRWVSWVEGGLVGDKKNPAGAGSFLFMRDQSGRSRMVSESVGNYPGKRVTHHPAPSKKFIPAEGGNK